MGVCCSGLSQLKWLWFHRQHVMTDMELFDLASRGPLGALQLMIRLRRPNLAFLGSLIVLVGLAIGPFTQQSCLTLTGLLLQRTTRPRSRSLRITLGELTVSLSLHFEVS